MKRIVFVCFAFLALFMFNSNVKAASCDANIINDAKKVKAYAKVAEVEEYGDKVTRIKIEVKNLTSDMYAVADLCDDDIVKYTKKKKTSIFPLYESPCTAEFEVFSNGNKCDKDSLLTTVLLEIPEYNPYSKRPICKKYKDYKYCQETFYEAMDLYNEVEPKIEALEKKDPKAAKAKKGNVIINTINEKINLTTVLIIISVVLGVGLIVIAIISVITYRKKTGK